MFLPEYTITNKILKNIASVEYAKAIAENTPILPSLEESVQKDAAFRLIKTLAQDMAKTFTDNDIKMGLDGIETTLPKDLAGIIGAALDALESQEDYTNSTLKSLHEILTGSAGYRSQKIPNLVDPEEILADTIELMDWCQSIDALETHPIIFGGIIRARMEVISCFETYNPIVSNLFTRMALRWRGYGIKNFLKYEERFSADKQSYQKAVYSIFKDAGDLTAWLEYYSEILAYDAMDIKERVVLGERQTKTAVAQGITDLTERQMRILQFLHNYGTMINKDFGSLFPSISEDSVLRDLKVLIDRGLIEKSGSTKSSKYKLKS